MVNASCHVFATQTIACQWILKRCTVQRTSWRASLVWRTASLKGGAEKHLTDATGSNSPGFMLLFLGPRELQCDSTVSTLSCQGSDWTREVLGL